MQLVVVILGGIHLRNLPGKLKTRRIWLSCTTCLASSHKFDSRSTSTRKVNGILMLSWARTTTCRDAQKFMGRILVCLDCAICQRNTSIHLSIYLSIYPSVFCLSIYLSICFLYIYIYPSICLYNPILSYPVLSYPIYLFLLILSFLFLSYISYLVFICVYIYIYLFTQRERERKSWNPGATARIPFMFVPLGPSRTPNVI
jgi:hypothetical protein